MSQDARTRRALELIGELSDPAAPEPGPGTPLAAIGFDSLAFAELALALEERLGLDLGHAELDAAATVGELLGAAATWPGDPGARGSASRSGTRSRSSASTIRVSVAVGPPSSHRSSVTRSSVTCARDTSRSDLLGRLTVGYPPRV